jgi:hypothetical protein
MSPDKLVEKLEQEAVLPAGNEERFSGYGVMSVTYRSGHVLALRHFPASSLGPSYTSIWHRNPEGLWNFYTDIAPQLSCPRYFGKAVAYVTVTPIQITWTGPYAFDVTADSPDFQWAVRLKPTASTAFLNLLSHMIPQPIWKMESVLEKVEKVAGKALDAGAITLSGVTPNGQKFMVNPHHIWQVADSKAIIAGEDAGPIGPLPDQAYIGDFCIPQKDYLSSVRFILIALIRRSMSWSRTYRPEVLKQFPYSPAILHRISVTDSVSGSIPAC